RPVLGGKLVFFVTKEPIGGKGGLLGQGVVDQAITLTSQVLAHVGAFSLHEVAGQEFTAGPGVQVGGGQFRVDQAQQVTKRRFLAAVRGGGDQQKVALVVLGHFLQEFVAQLALMGAGVVGGHAGVGLVHDHQVRAVADEVVTVAGGLDEVGGDDDVLVFVEQ